MSSSLASSPAGSPPSPPSRGLAALASIIAELASSQPLEESVARSLESLRITLDAAECAIWLHSKDGLVRSWGTGNQSITASQVIARLAHEEPVQDSIVVTGIGSGAGQAGALAVHVIRELDDEELLLVTAVANLLGPELAHAEKIGSSKLKSKRAPRRSIANGSSPRRSSTRSRSDCT